MRRLLGVFSDPDAFAAALEAVKDQEGVALEETWTPLPPPDAGRLHDARPLGWAALAGAVLTFASVYGLEAWSAILGYPINAGGRPLHAWPAFLLPAAEFAMLGAGVWGVAAFLIRAGLGALNHPDFDLEPVGQAGGDRMVVAIRAGTLAAGRRLLMKAGADDVRELPS